MRQLASNQDDNNVSDETQLSTAAAGRDPPGKASPNLAKPP